MAHKLSKLHCRKCRTPFKFEEDALRCPNCQSVHRIIDGIPRLESEEVNRFEEYHRYDKKSDYMAEDVFAASGFYPQFIPEGAALILDAGGGDGIATALYAQNNPQATIYLTDANRHLLKRSFQRQLDNLVPVQSSISELPYEDGLFDAVMNVFVMEHMRPPVLDKFFSEVYRVTKPGGRFIIATDGPVYDKYIHSIERLLTKGKWLTSGWTRKNGIGHINLKYPSQTARLLEEKGFKVKSKQVNYMGHRVEPIRRVLEKLPGNLGENLFATIYVLTAEKPA